jgi:hypothetical protein
MRFFSTAVAVLAGSLCLPGFVSAQPASEKVTPSELLAKKDELTNKQVTVEGTLTNSGTNYFTDLRVLLKDNKDSQSGVLVQPWLPVETPPRQTSGSSSTPTLSDFLGKKVEIRGVLTDSVVKHVGSSKVLRVESARTID